jgi:phospholipase C
MPNQLGSIQHIVHLMLENRSFDHMLGFLYSDSGNVSPTGQPFEGLTGTESNLDSTGKPVTVFRSTSPSPAATSCREPIPAKGT